ncbi:MAG: hypothetical protein ACREYC_23205 [Gammaproteobacteria bacterium]
MNRTTSIDTLVGVSSQNRLRLEWVRTDRGLTCRWFDTRTRYHPAAPFSLSYAHAGQTRAVGARAPGLSPAPASRSIALR